MRLTVLGGGGFRVPLVYAALLRDPDRVVAEVVLHDVDPARVAVIRTVLARLADGHPGAPAVTVARSLDEAVTGADFVFSAIRVGGLAGRVADERVALAEGLLGQETTGPGGLAFALRTVPVARHVAERVRACAPDAFVINFTNPAGLITEAMRAVLGPRVVGICDTPLALGRRLAARLGLPPDGVRFDYAGLNHLGWLRGLEHDGVDHLPRLLADDELAAGTEEGAIFGVPWLRALGMVPNEYLYYYYFTREAVAGIRDAGRTRGEFLQAQQAEFYRIAAAEPDAAARHWRDVVAERNRTYLADARGAEQSDVDGGGYEGVALAVVRAIALGRPAELILNVGNGGALPGLPEDAVVEVPCAVDADGARPLPVSPLTGHPLGLAQQVKAVERLTIRAAVEGSRELAGTALALHPLVDSAHTARRLLDGYLARIPELAAVLTGP